MDLDVRYVNIYAEYFDLSIGVSVFNALPTKISARMCHYCSEVIGAYLGLHCSIRSINIVGSVQLAITHIHMYTPKMIDDNSL